MVQKTRKDLRGCRSRVFEFFILRKIICYGPGTCFVCFGAGSETWREYYDILIFSKFWFLVLRYIFSVWSARAWISVTWCSTRRRLFDTCDTAFERHMCQLLCPQFSARLLANSSSHTHERLTNLKFLDFRNNSDMSGILDFVDISWYSRHISDPAPKQKGHAPWQFFC